MKIIFFSAIILTFSPIKSLHKTFMPPNVKRVIKISCPTFSTRATTAKSTCVNRELLANLLARRTRLANSSTPIIADLLATELTISYIKEKIYSCDCRAHACMQDAENVRVITKINANLRLEIESDKR